MKKALPTKEEMLRMEYELNECKEIFPQELNELLALTFDLFRPYINIEVPMGNELQQPIERYIDQHYPLIAQTKTSWYRQWMVEIAEFLVQDLATQLTMMVEDFRKGIDLKKNYTDFETLASHFNTPKKATRAELYNFEGTAFWQELDDAKRHEIIAEMLIDIEEDYKFAKEECERFNGAKKTFIECVQPIIFKYLDEYISEFDEDSWKIYGIILGHIFIVLEEHCVDLETIIEANELENDPKKKFMDYLMIFNRKHYPSIYPTPTNETENTDVTQPTQIADNTESLTNIILS